MLIGEIQWDKFTDAQIGITDRINIGAVNRADSAVSKWMWPPFDNIVSTVLTQLEEDVLSEFDNAEKP